MSLKRIIGGTPKRKHPFRSATGNQKPTDTRILLRRLNELRLSNPDTTFQDLSPSLQKFIQKAASNTGINPIMIAFIKNLLITKPSPSSMKSRFSARFASNVKRAEISKLVDEKTKEKGSINMRNDHQSANEARSQISHEINLLLRVMNNQLLVNVSDLSKPDKQLYDHYSELDKEGRAKKLSSLRDKYYMLRPR